MWRLAEGAAKLTAEMSAGESSCAGHVVDPDRLEVARVGEVSGTQQVAGRRDDFHVVVRSISTATHRALDN